MAEPMLLSVDELRAAARLAGVPVAPLVSDDDPDEPRVDLAALRGLAARGLVVGLAEASPEPAGDLVAALAALDEPEWLLDLDLDRAVEDPSDSAMVGGRAAAAAHRPAVERRRQHGEDDRNQRWNHAVGPHGSVTLTAVRAGFVHVDWGACLDLDGLATTCGLPGSPTSLPAPPPGDDEADGDPRGHVDGTAPTSTQTRLGDDRSADDDGGPGGAAVLIDIQNGSGDDGTGDEYGDASRDRPLAGFEVGSEVHVDADAYALDGDLNAAVTTLVDAGVADSVARQWVDAVASRRSAAAVRVVRRLHGGATEVRELRWLVGGDGQVWRVDGGSAHGAAGANDTGHRGGDITGSDELAIGGSLVPISGDDEDRSRVRLVGTGELRAALAEILTPPLTPAAAGSAIRTGSAEAGTAVGTWPEGGDRPSRAAPSSPPDDVAIGLGRRWA
jgi:hypothetical protein